METVIGGILYVTIGVSVLLVNACLGFLGLVIAQYRENRYDMSFRAFHQSKETEMVVAWKKGDRSPLVACCIFAIAGCILFPLLILKLNTDYRTKQQKS